ncbi:MAG: dihydropyrimidinase [Pseudomonadota bacterium]
MSLLIRNAKIVTAEREFKSDVFIEGETVRKIGPALKAKADSAIDAAGKLVIPGGIDPHTHFDMPYGDTVSSDDFETGTMAAACGGTTTIIDFAAQDRGRPMLEGLETWHRKAAGKAAIDYGFHMMVTDVAGERVDEMTRLIDEGVTSFKFFTAYPTRLLLDDGAIFRAMRKAKTDGTLIMMHAENGMVIEELVAQALRDGKTEPKEHARTRPPWTEAEAVSRTAKLAEVSGAFLYIVHLSCAEALEELKEAQKRGVRILAETCPQYLFLDEGAYNREIFEAAKFVMSPPLRKKANQAKLWTGLKTGDLACVGTDHCPFPWEEKKRGAQQDFTRIPGGGPGVENRMSLVYDGGVARGRISLRRFVEITSTSAAKLFGLYPRKGTIAVGSDADLVILDPQKRETISVGNPRTHHMRVDYSLYEGMTVQGFPEVVVSRGRIVARDGKFVGKAGAGRFLRRGLPNSSLF